MMEAGGTPNSSSLPNRPLDTLKCLFIAYPDLSAALSIEKRYFTSDLTSTSPHTAYRGEVAGLDLPDRGARLGRTTDDLVAGHAGVDGPHYTIPPISNLVKVGMTDAAKQSLNLNVMFRRIVSPDRGRLQGRCCTGSGIGFVDVRNLRDCCRT
jgi:hypothetical protein